VPLSKVVFLGDCAAVYKNNPHTIEELQQEISVAVICVSVETLAAVGRISDFDCRWSWTSMARTLKVFLRDCQSLKTTDLRDTPNTVMFAV
jgi:hypothetical protein